MKVVIKGPLKVRITREVVHHIKAWRNHRELSVEKLGEMSGVSGSMISQLERGKTTYTQNTLEKLAGSLGVQPWQLLACGPDENKELWNIVLSRGTGHQLMSDFSYRDQLVLHELLSNNCDAAIKSCRSIVAQRESDEVESS